MSDLLKALNGHPAPSESLSSWMGMIATTTVLVLIVSRLG